MKFYPYVFGVKVEKPSVVIEKVKEKLRKDKEVGGFEVVVKERRVDALHIITLNGEMIVDSFSDEKFRDLLLSANRKENIIHCIDSVSLSYALYYLNTYQYCDDNYLHLVKSRDTLRVLHRRISVFLRECFQLLYSFGARYKIDRVWRLPGVDLMTTICKIASDNDASIFLLGSTERVLKRTKANLEGKIKGIKIAGMDPCEMHVDVRKVDHRLIERINESRASILFVAFGHKKQEMWIQNHLSMLKNIRIAMGVGGSFDYISGEVQRASEKARKSGFEWFYRFWNNPLKRSKRIFRAIFVFLWRLLMWKVSMYVSYRENVCAVIYQKVGRKKEFLLFSRVDDPDHWQFLQGGKDCDDDVEALYREIYEESKINRNDIKTVRKFPEKRFYDWSKDGIGADQRVQCIFFHGKRGQVQTIFLVEFFGDPSRIIVDKKEFQAYKWVREEKVAETLHEVRRDIWNSMMRNEYSL